MAITQAMVDFFNYLFNKPEPQHASVIDGEVSEETKPTQSNKPSPSSSISIADAYRKLKKVYPEKEGFTISQIANTNSMEPYIDANCLVVLEVLDDTWRSGRLNRQPLKKGDVVVWNAGTTRIIHEIIDVKPDGYVIKGKNNFSSDLFGRPISEKLIVCRLHAIVYCRQDVDGD